MADKCDRRDALAHGLYFNSVDIYLKAKVFQNISQLLLINIYECAPIILIPPRNNNYAWRTHAGGLALA